MVTPCTHSFHEECLMDWVNTKMRKVCEDMSPLVNAYAKLRDEGPECPNCNESIIKGKKIKLMKASALRSPIKLLAKKSTFAEDLL